MHSGQAERSPAPKTIDGSLGEAREDERFLSTNVFTFRIQGQAEGCPGFFVVVVLLFVVFFFLKRQSCLRKKYSIAIFFYITKVISFWSYAVVILLQLMFSSCHCMRAVPFPSLPRNRTGLQSQNSVVNWCRVQWFRQTTFTSAGKVAQENMRRRGHLSGTFSRV